MDLNNAVGLRMELIIFHPQYLNDLLDTTRRFSWKSHAFPCSPSPCSAYLQEKYKLLTKENCSNSNSETLRSDRNCNQHHDKAEPNLQKGRHVLDELIRFEHRLLETLRILTMISEEINGSNHWRDHSFLREIFKDIPSLYRLHQHLTTSLDELDVNPVKNILPSVFINDTETPFLNIYKSFISRYGPNYQRLTNLVLKEKEFSNLAKLCVASSKYEEQRIQDVCGMYFGVHSSLTRYRLLFSIRIRRNATQGRHS
ncbi:unnamed protein product [Dicrocoelium dendriticum]|nr:unnamed protein product [Dicrocoelium dendriticum]